MAKEIVISAEAPDLIPVELVGQKYTVRPIKSSLGLQMAQQFNKKDQKPEDIAEALDSIIGTLFGKEKPKIIKRLGDSEDLLDYVHIMELINALAERASGNPTTS